MGVPRAAEGPIVIRRDGWSGGTFERCAMHDCVIVSGDFDECVSGAQ